MKKSIKEEKAYRTQGKKPTCGPYVLYNLMIWADNKKRLKYIKSILGYHDGCGTFSPNIDYALKRLGKIRIEDRILHPKLSDIDKAIDNGYAVILRYYRNNKHNGHYALCIGRTKKCYTMVNASRKIKPATVANFTRKTISKYIKRNKNEFAMTAYPCAWVVKKK